MAKVSNMVVFGKRKKLENAGRAREQARILSGLRAQIREQAEEIEKLKAEILRMRAYPPTSPHPTTLGY